MQVEISQLELRYAQLRIRDAAQRSKLLASLAQDGQQSPVMVVVAEAAERYVLIDGYARVEVLRELARDVVEATVLSLSEADALVKMHRLEGERRRSPLEEGWLLETLMQGHGLTLSELATRLGRSKSWVSRRLALVTSLPASVQERVRVGQLGAHVATKYLVPLARANAAQCATLVTGLRGHRPTVREMGALYSAWRQGADEVRTRIVRAPMLFLKTLDAEEPMDEAASRLLTDLRSLGAIARRSERRVEEGAYRDAAPSSRHRLARAWSHARRSFASLRDTTEPWEDEDAGARDPDGDPSPPS